MDYPVSPRRHGPTKGGVNLEAARKGPLRPYSGFLSGPDPAELNWIVEEIQIKWGLSIPP